MFSNAYVSSALRFVVLVALQVLVLAHVGEGTVWGRYAQIILYPLIILLLPVGMPSALVVLIGFVVGTAVDVPLGTYGVHAGALVLTAFARRGVLGILEPREGYTVDQSPTRAALGFQWFATYAAVLMGIHTLTYFALEAFTFVYFVEIVLRALGSFCVSMILILMYVLVLDPKR